MAESQWNQKLATINVIALAKNRIQEFKLHATSTCSVSFPWHSVSYCAIHGDKSQKHHWWRAMVAKFIAESDMDGSSYAE